MLCWRWRPSLRHLSLGALGPYPLCSAGYRGPSLEVVSLLLPGISFDIGSCSYPGCKTADTLDLCPSWRSSSKLRALSKQQTASVVFVRVIASFHEHPGS
ncbi:hypothetical protein DAEQUDRAFT_82514 [Daedalea quercina L-15889]|uniref:Uncharacterized protein n=1 Tax=Daedalea quercina L-15889 TaxID=1314783 RepID=A0A165SHQ4_9APHY|nr:hypothetical protein DAEQUDRAFT_82514 [Daedalea quercina L-15889]